MTTSSAYNNTAWSLTHNYTLCAQGMAYYNITRDTEFTDAMYNNDAWFSEYQRVCEVNPDNLPTSAFNTSIVLSTESPTGATSGSSMPSSTPASTGASPTLSQTASETATSTSTSTPTGGISPNGLCGSSNNGWTCKGSTFGNCCSIYGDW